MNGKGFRTTVWGLALGLTVWTGTASALRAAGDEGEGGKKVEKQRVVVIKDGKPMVYDSDGPQVSRGYLGVALLDLTPELRAHFGVPDDSGVMVSKVEAGSPADKAGIKVGDILTSIDGKAMKSSWDVMGKVRSYDNNQQVPVEIWRNGKAQTVSAPVVLRERSELEILPLLGKAGGDGDHFLLKLDGDQLLKDGKWLEGDGKWLGKDGQPIHLQRLKVAGREADLEKRLKELEKKIDELQKQLEKKK
ncbi:MAG TPA: PDZ domain-containing protein [Thermoanaerobaculia bacterium]|nr:PDZ domain-containing protein [Thermoanaerobaculia bacterium]